MLLLCQAFLCASFDQHERALAPLEQELTIVRMYLDIDMLRFGSRLNVEQAIATKHTRIKDDLRLQF